MNNEKIIFYVIASLIGMACIAVLVYYLVLKPKPKPSIPMNIITPCKNRKASDCIQSGDDCRLFGNPKGKGICYKSPCKSDEKLCPDGKCHSDNDTCQLSCSDLAGHPNACKFYPGCKYTPPSSEVVGAIGTCT